MGAKRNQKDVPHQQPKAPLDSPVGFFLKGKDRRERLEQTPWQKTFVIQFYMQEHQYSLRAEHANLEHELISLNEISGKNERGHRADVLNSTK
jgi:hypothetical protein